MGYVKNVAKSLSKEEFFKRFIVRHDDQEEFCELLEVSTNRIWECPDDCGLVEDCEDGKCNECWEKALLTLQLKEDDKDTEISIEKEEVKKDTYTLIELSNMGDMVKFKSTSNNNVMYFEDNELWLIAGELAGSINITKYMLNDTYTIHVDPIYVSFAEALEQLQEGKTIISKVANNKYNIVNGILHRNGMPLLPKHTSSILYEEIIGEWVVM